MLRSIAACALAGAVAVNGIATISAKGSKFFTSDGEQFYIKGKRLPLDASERRVAFERCD